MKQPFGILGFPVAHTRSPAMHNAAFRELDLDAVYVGFEVHPERLGDAVRGLSALGVRGANVTVPHKSTVMSWLYEVTPAARAIGAVNTLVRKDERWIGHNTDAPGLTRALEEAGVTLDDAYVVVLGAGGAARASVVGLAQRGAREIVVAARRAEQSATLVADLQSACGPCRLHAIELDAAALRRTFSQASLVVQSTSATLSRELAADFAASLPLDALPGHASVVDLVYTPRETAVLAAARERGLRCVDGLGMLLYQGALAFELWTGRRAPIEIMRTALEAP